MDFKTKLQKAIDKNNSLLCVGLDPDPDNLNNFKNQFDFNKNVIDQTAEFVCCFKPNIAFFEANGIDGLNDLKKTISYLKENYSHIPILLDVKRADVENTARMYAKAYFEFWQADAVTLFPHLGYNVAEPFLSYKDKMVFMLVRTTANESESMKKARVGKDPYYLAIAKEIKGWPNQNGIGIFVGSTFTEGLKKVREIFPEKIFLTAGLGAQGASVENAVKAGIDKNGAGIMFNASRSIIYAPNPRSAAQNLRDEINKYRE